MLRLILESAVCWTYLYACQVQLCHQLLAAKTCLSLWLCNRLYSGTSFLTQDQCSRQNQLFHHQALDSLQHTCLCKNCLQHSSRVTISLRYWNHTSSNSSKDISIRSKVSCLEPIESPNFCRNQRVDCSAGCRTLHILNQDHITRAWKSHHVAASIDNQRLFLLQAADEYVQEVVPKCCIPFDFNSPGTRSRQDLRFNKAAY